MEDQKKSLERKNINCLVFNSNTTFSKLSIETNEYLKNKKIGILFFSPESIIKNRIFIKKLIKKDLCCLITFDESHLICDWSEFRSDYKNLYKLKDYTKKYKKNIPLVCLSATLPLQTIKYITNNIKLKDPKIIKSSFLKKSLSIEIKLRENIDNTLKYINSLIQNLDKNSKTIIFCKTRKDTEFISNTLSSSPFNLYCKAYHAGLTNKIRNEIQQEYSSDKLNIISCTIAFGMGIDIPNIHLCFHWGISKNIDAYVQEIGRTSRDAKEGKCIAFYTEKDFCTNRYFADQIEDTNLKNYEIKKINQLSSFIYNNTTCRMKQICLYFGENLLIL